MKQHFIALALIACGAGLSVLATWRAQQPHPLQQRPTAAPVDLAALQQQADAALGHLRQAQQRHATPVRTTY